MPNEIILLTGDAEAPQLQNILLRHNPDLVIVHVRSRGELEEACLNDKHWSRRLISFCSPIIVPLNILNAVMAPSYNFHPGPPTYPGSHVASFAIYDEVEMFGVTVHEMVAKVDSGPIVAVDWFQIPDNTRFIDLELKAFATLVRLFVNLAPHLAINNSPLEQLEIGWAGRATTKRDFERMRKINETMSETEIKRRFRAFG